MISNNIGSWYLMQLRRPSATSFTAALFTDAGSPVVSETKTYTAMPARANIYIGLGPTARFDWIAVPEPTSAMIGLGALVLHRRREK